MTTWVEFFAAQDKAKVLMISHKLGGGVQQHIDELVTVCGNEALFLQMIPHQDGASVLVSCLDQGRRLQDGLRFGIATEYDKLVNLLRALGVGRVHFHHTVGLPQRLWALATDLDCDYDLTVHDYYLVNGNPTLTNKSARYVDDASPDFDRQCSGRHPLPAGISAERWRAKQRELVRGADRIIFPSQDCYQRFSRFFDVGNAVVAWHTDSPGSKCQPEPEWHYRGDRPLRVLVLGALNREKGADILESVASGMTAQTIEFHLLGYAYRALGSSIVTHGPYDKLRVDELIRGIAPDVVWFPAQWPETYSYTLSVALRNGFPVVVPDIGAFPERVSGRPLSPVVDWDMSVRQWRMFWMEVLQERTLPEGNEPGTRSCQSIDDDFYALRYLQIVNPRVGSVDRELLDGLARHLHKDASGLSLSERFLEGLWRLSRQPVVARLVSMVPVRVQRAIKRLLSHRPMHDIVGK